MQSLQEQHITQSEIVKLIYVLYRKVEGCPIHPTRVNSSLVFAIRLTRNRFVGPIPSNRHESFLLLSIRHARSRFARDLENIVDLDFEGGLKMLYRFLYRFLYRYFTDLDFRWAMQGGLKMLSIRIDSIELTRIVSPVVDSSCRKSICETLLRANRVET